MKIISVLIRAGISLTIAFAISFSSAVIYFDYTGYKNTIDRFMLVTIPTLAMGFLLFQAIPTIWHWLKPRKINYLIVFAIFSTIAAIVTVLPAGTSRVYLMATFSYGLALLAITLPAIPALERLSRQQHTVRRYFVGFLLSFLILYLLIGFMIGAIYDRFHFMAISTLSMMICNICAYYFIRHFARSQKIKHPLNRIIVFALPLFAAIIFLLVSQFPVMFSPAFFQIPSSMMDTFVSCTIVGGAWGILLLEQIEKRGIYQKCKNTKLFSAIKENSLGIYVSIVFFFINLFLARTFNQTTFSFNSIIFEADAGPWYAILGLPEGFNVNRAVHPLTLITIRPFVRFFGLFMRDSWFLAPLIGVSLTNAFAIFMSWVFIKRATNNETHALLFSALLGATASHLLFGSLTETYVFGMASLIFFLLLLQADEKRFAVLVPAGLLVFGITVTNIAQSMIAMFFKKIGFWRLIYYGVLVLTIGITLTAFVNMLFPGNQSSFWVPEDILFEAQFSTGSEAGVKASLIERSQIVTRTMFLYSVLAPTPVQTIRGRGTEGEIVNFKTYHYKDKIVAWYDGLAKIPLVLWIAILITSVFLFFKNIRTDENTPLLYGILGGIAFNFFLHMNYGTELFLYTPYFTFLVVFFVALSLKPLTDKLWFETGVSVLIFMVFINNFKLIHTILSALSPYLSGN